MNQFTVAIYVILDDILKAAKHDEDPQRRINDAMVITTLMIACQYFGGNIEKARLYMRCHHCREMLSKSQFNRRMHRIKGLIEEVFGFFAEIFKQENTMKNYLIDSFPVAVCQNIRISCCQILDGEVYRGKCASKRVYFYGFKVAVLTTQEGLPVEIAFLPGSYSDVQFLNRMHCDLAKESSIFADGGFQKYEVEDTAAETEQIMWEVCRPKKSLRGDSYQIALWKKSMRRRIESVFAAIAVLFPKTIHAVTVDGFLLKTFLFVFTYGVHKWLPDF